MRTYTHVLTTDETGADVTPSGTRSW